MVLIKRKPDEAAVHAAIQKILDDTASYTKSLNYAIGYCRASRSMTGRELKTQVLYILNNIIYWRHPDAKEVRETLKAFTA